MNKFWKQTMALFLAFALVFGTLVPVVAWAEEPANVEEPTVESESEAPAEQPVQTAPEKKLTEEETEGKATEAPEELELSEEKTPDAQGEPASTDKPFTVTKRAYDNPSDPEEKVKDCDTLYEALEACKQEELGTLYIVTMNKNYDIPEAEHCLYTSSVNILLRSKEGEKYTLTRHGTRLVFGATKNCEFKTQNIIFDGNNDGEFTYVSEGGKLTLGDGTVVQHFIDVPNNSGPAIYLSGNPELNVDSILNIEFGAVIQNNKSENPKGSVIKLDDLQCTLNINGGTFKGNQSNYLGGVVESLGKVYIHGGTFTSNKANYGGVIASFGELEITGGEFDGNIATTTGGAIHIGKQSQKCSIVDATFKNNSAAWGGVVYTLASTTIKNSSFMNNSATKDGGAIYAQNLMDIKESRFLYNFAKHDGGAIFDTLKEYAPKITDSKAYRNLTTDAKTLFQGNKADGGLFNPPSNFADFTNLGFAKESDVRHEILTRESLLNNYDVNYQNDMRLIVYKANGGKFANGSDMIVKEYPLNKEIKIMEAPTRPGYKFQYWQGSKYQPGDDYKVERNHTFTAIWEGTPPTPSRDERIIVDPNGGTFSDGSTGRKTYDLKAGETFVLPAAPTRDGYKFIAWEGKSGTYQPGDKYTVKRGGEVFTARWEEEKKPEEKPSVTPNIKMPKGTPLTPDEIAKILAGMKKTVPAIPRAGVGK